MLAASCSPQSQRSEPNASPVRHSECTRTSTFFPVADIALHKRHMVFAVERVAEAVCDERAVCGRHFGRRDGLDQVVVRFAVFLQVFDRDERQAPFFGFFSELACAHHGAVVAHDFAAQADLFKACQAQEVDRCFRMAVSGQNAASFCDEREVVAGTAEIFGTSRFFGAFAGCEGSFDSRNTRRRIDVVDGNGEGRFVVICIFADHGRQA